MTVTTIPLGSRFPAAHQIFRMRLTNATFPAVPAVVCFAEERVDGWEVAIRSPELSYEARAVFTADELRSFRGPWPDWVDVQVEHLAGARPA